MIFDQVVKFCSAKFSIVNILLQTMKTEDTFGRVILYTHSYIWAGVDNILQWGTALMKLDEV